MKKVTIYANWFPRTKKGFTVRNVRKIRERGSFIELVGRRGRTLVRYPKKGIFQIEITKQKYETPMPTDVQKQILNEIFGKPTNKADEKKETGESENSGAKQNQ